MQKILKITKKPISIETPIGEEEDSRLGDLIEDKEVRQDFDLSRERIRQIADKALGKLKHSSRVDHLKSFVDC